MIKNNIKTLVKTTTGAEIDLTPYKKAREAFFSARTKKILAILAVIFAIFASIYKFVLPDFIKPQMVYDLIKSSVNQGYALDIKDLKTDLSWDLALVLDASEINLLHNTQTLIHSKKSQVKLPIIGLLLKNFNNSQFYSTSADAYLERDASGILNIKKAFKIKEAPKEISKFRVAIKDYDIIFVDNGAPPIVLNGYNLDLGNLKLYRLKTFGTIAFADGDRAILNINFICKKPISRGEFILKGDVENLNLKKIEKYLKEFVPEISKAQGLIRGDFDIDSCGREKITNNLKVALNTNNVYISTKKYPYFFEIADDAQIFAEGKYYHHKLNFKKCRVISRDYNLDLTGIIKDIDKKIKKIDIYVKSKNSNGRKLMGLVPKTMQIKHDGVNKALKYKVNAIVSCNLKAKGNANSAKYWGNINVKNFVVDGDITKSKSRIDFSYKRRKATINANLQDTSNGVLKAFGTTSLGRVSKMEFEIYSNRFLLTEFCKKIIAMSDILELNSGILPDLLISKGEGKINASISGSGKDANIDGYLQLSDTNLKYKKLSEQTYFKLAHIKFQKRKIFIENQEFFIQGKKLIATGFISLDKEADATISAQNLPLSLGISLLKNSELFEKAHKGAEEILNANGNINLNIKILQTHLRPEIQPHGKIQFLNNSLQLVKLSTQASQICGLVTINGNEYTPQNLSGKILKGDFRIEGKVKNNKIDAKFIAQHIDFTEAVKTILTSKISAKIAPLFKEMKTPSGTLDGTINLKGDIASDFFDKIECNNFALKFALSEILAPVKVDQGSLAATKTELTINKIIFDILNAKGTLQGKVRNLDKKPAYDLYLDINNIDKSIFEAIKKCKFSAQTQKIVASLGEFSGTASAHIQVKDSIKGKITFNNIGLKFLPAGLPIKIKNGDLIIDKNEIKLPNYQIQIGNSKFKVLATMSQQKGLEADLSGNLTPDEIDRYLNKILLQPLHLKQSTPVKIHISKNKNGLKAVGGLLLKPDNVISYKSISIGDESNYYCLGGGFSQLNNVISFNNLGVCQYPNELLAFLGYNNPLSPKNFLAVSGWINKNSQDENLHLYSRDFMNINLLNEVLSQKTGTKIFHNGSFRADTTLKGKINAPKITGELELRSAKIPMIKTDITALKLIFTDDLIYLKDGILRITDSEFNVNGIIENVIETPYVFKSLDATSDYINIDEMVKVFATGGVTKSALPFFVVKKGTLASKKMIISNLATDNVVADFAFTPDWVLSVDKFGFSAADGEVVGNMSLDFDSFYSKTHMRFKNLKANAVATTLLQMPNEIYGILNGEANFSTKGVSRTDLIKNSNGNLKFQITSGRLVRLGSLEYLLTAAEVLKSGVTGLCLNNICTLLAPHKSGNFDTMNVDFKVKNGVLFTDDLVSRGHNLSIYLAGNFDMTTNYSDFTILGRVSKSVINILGPLGELSINKLVNAIPGGSSSGNGVLENLSKFPGVDFNDKSYRRFFVNIEGDLYDQKSVKNFRWID